MSLCQLTLKRPWSQNEFKLKDLATETSVYGNRLKNKILFMDFEYAMHNWNLSTFDFEDYNVADPDGLVLVMG